MDTETLKTILTKIAVALAGNNINQAAYNELIELIENLDKKKEE